MAPHPTPPPGPFEVLALVGLADGELGGVLAALPADVNAAVLISGETTSVEGVRPHPPRPVHGVQPGTLLEPGHVYVLPARAVVEVRPDLRCAVMPTQDLTAERPLDRLLASLAISAGPRALAVILEERGPDGVAGARALHGVGGTVLTPRAARQAGAPDGVTAPQDLGHAVAGLLAGRQGSLSPADDVRAAEHRQAFLLALSDALRPLADPVTVVGVACRLLGEHLGVDRAYYVEVDEAAGVARVARDWVRDGGVSLVGEHRVADFSWSVAILRRGECHVIPDTQTSELVPPADRPASAALGIIACMGAPLIKQGRLVGALCVTTLVQRTWTGSEVGLLRDVGERIWAAVERARAEDALRALNVTLEARVEERTQRLAEANGELQSRTRALEAFVALTQDLSVEVDPYALVRQGQKVALSLLPAGFATYYEPEGTRWRLRVQEGDMHNPALQAAADAGFPLGGLPSLDRPWASGQPLFQSSYDRDTDGLGSLEHAVISLATLPLSVGGRRQGVFAVALFRGRQWSRADRAVLETVVRSLRLALERSEAVRALAEEREALGAFAHFTERTAGTRDVAALAQQATDVLGQVLDLHSAVYFELDGELWRLRHTSTPLEPELDTALRRGVPAGLPSFALPTERREPVFFENVDVSGTEPAPPVVFRAVASYPLLAPNQPAGMLSMGVTDRPVWTEREKAVFRAVGDSFRLALERTAHLQQVERHRERLADLNAELGTLITRTARTLELPVGYLNEFLASGRGEDLPSPLPLALPAALHDELSRLRGVAQDLRHLARLENQTLHRELLPLGEVIAEARAASAPAGRVDWFTLALPIVRADRALLKQALEVLLTFTLSETRGARLVEVSSQEVGGEVWVTVQDDGIGLEPEEAATLFDLAVRTEQAVPLLDGGGLIQVRRILARHGGWAWAEARLTGGRIVLALPRDEAVSTIEQLIQP